MDGYQISELYAWDIAATVLIIPEAGGYCCKPDGSPIDLDDPKLIWGTRKELCDALVQLNKDALGIWFKFHLFFLFGFLFLTFSIPFQIHVS